jgi:hypothetical protein
MRKWENGKMRKGEREPLEIVVKRLKFTNPKKVSIHNLSQCHFVCKTKIDGYCFVYKIKMQYFCFVYNMKQEIWTRIF